jgi:hypothetical protein
VRQLPADALEDAVFAIVRRAASDPALVERAAAESNRIASELLEPARARLKSLQSELAANTQERNRLLDALLALGAAGVSTARDRMVALETRATALQASIAEEEGRLDVESQRSLSLASIHEVLRDFDALQAHFTAGERREFLHEIVDEVRVFPDRVEVALYDGTHAAAPLAQAKRRARKAGGGAGGAGGAASGGVAEGGAVTGPDVHAVHAAVHAESAVREPGAKTKNARRTRVEFAERVEWLPNTDARQSLGKKDRRVFWLGVSHPFIDPSSKRLSRKRGSVPVVPRVPTLRPSRKQELEALMASGTFPTRADLARHLGVSRAYVTQVLGPVVHAVHAQREDVPHGEEGAARGGGA